MSADKTRYIVTLIHGTFAHEPEKREWTLPGSSTEEILKATLLKSGQAEVEFTEPFIWTGSNNHRQRLKAGNDLATVLIKEKRNQGDKRILVGHSHGGNVILYALKELSSLGIEEKVDGVITLATPYLTASKRSLKDTFGVIGILCGIIAWLTIGYFYVFALFELLEKINGTLNLIIGGLLFTIGGIAIGKYIHGLIHGMLHDRVVKFAGIKANKIQAVAPPIIPMLSISVIGDEALGGLKIIERTASSPVVIWKLLTKVISVAFLLGIIASMIFVDTDFENITDQTFGEILTYSALALIAALLLVWVVSLLRRPAFGSESLILRTCLDIRVDDKPFGFVTPRCENKIFKRDELESELKGLKHSLPYQSQKILNYAADWMTKVNHLSK